MEGVALLSVVRRMTEAIVIVVGGGESDRMARALFEGADAYLQHPVDRAHLRSRLRALLRRRTLTQRKAGGARQLASTRSRVA